MIKTIIFSLLSLVMLSTQNLHAQESEKKAKVLDFDDDLIKGEDERPDLLSLIGNKKIGINSIIYLRKNFNDFHKYDKKKKLFFNSPIKE